MSDNQFNSKYKKIFRDINNIGEIVKVEDFFNEKEMEAVMDYRKHITNNKENPIWLEKIKALASEYPALTQEIFQNPKSPQFCVGTKVIFEQPSKVHFTAI